MLARLTILGLYEYDNTIFDGLELPEGINLENVVNATLDKGATFGCIYPNPMFLKKYITQWGKRHYNMFQRWINVLNSEYNPIRDYYIQRNRNIIGNEIKETNENLKETTGETSNYEETYDRSRSVSELEESENERRATKVSDYDETNYNERTSTESEEKDTTVSSSGGGTTEEQVSAFDSNSYSPRSKTISNSSDNSTTNETGSKESTINDGGGKQADETITDNINDSGVIKDNTIEGIEDATIYEKTISGTKDNVNKVGEEGEHTESLDESVVATKGERSVQDLIKEEIELAKFEICEKIADMLVADICIMVY